MTLKNSQSGVAIYYVLLAVALFAALGMTVSSMMRSPSGSISSEKLSIYAAEMISTAQRIRDTVKNLQISNDCEAEDISFENNFIDGYAHSPAASESCKVFANAAYVPPNVEWLDGAHQDANRYGEYVFTDLAIDGIGSDQNELIAVLNYVQTSLCTAINDKAQVSTLPVNAGGMDITEPFVGSFDFVVGIDAPELQGRTFGCLQNASGTLNAFYYVLVAR